MKSILNIAILFLLAMTLAFCSDKKHNSKTENTVVTLAENFNNKEIFKTKTLEYINLETKNECLLGQVLNLQITEKYIYILDRNTLFFFNLNGSFNHKLKKGDGPGELNYPINFSYNKDFNELYVIDKGNILHTYDDEGNHIRTQKFERSFNDLIRLDKNTIAFKSAYPAKYESHLIYLYNIEKDNFDLKSIEIEGNPLKNFSLLTYNNFTQYDNSAYFFASNFRDIYKLDGYNFKSIYSLDFGKYTPDESIAKKQIGVRDYIRFSNEEGFISFITYNYFLDNIMITGLKHSSFDCGITMLDEGKMILGNISEFLNLPQTSSFKYPVCIKDNNICFLYNNDVLLETNSSEENILEIYNTKIEIQENNNPILIKVLI